MNKKTNKINEEMMTMNKKTIEMNKKQWAGVFRVWCVYCVGYVMSVCGVYHDQCMGARVSLCECVCVCVCVRARGVR